MVDSSRGGIAENVSLLGSLRSRIRDIRGKRPGFIVGISLSAVICSVVLFLLPLSIFGYLIIAIVGVGLPYYMGLRRVIHIIIYGLGLMVLLSFVFSGTYTHYIYLAPSTVTQDASHNTTSGYYFGTGSVSPVSGSGTTQFTFTVQFYHPDTGGGNTSVYLLVDRLFLGGTALNTTMSPVSNTTVSSGQVLTTYSYSTTLPANEVYIMQFKSNVSGTWVPTTFTVTPRTSTQTDTFVRLIVPSILVVFLSVATLFFGLALIVLLIRQSRTRREQIARARQQRLSGRAEESAARRQGVLQGAGEKRPASKREKFICTSCGTEVTRDATVCPKCGEKFD